MGKTNREQELEAENKRLRAENEQLRGELKAAQQSVAALEKLVEELKAALAKALSQSFTAPSTPSGQRPPFTKPSKPPGETTKKKKPGRKAGHPGAARQRPKKIDRVEPHTLSECPHCGKPVKQLCDQQGNPSCRSRTIEDIVLGAMEAIEHHIHQYWCHECNRRVEPVVTTALPHARLGLNMMVTTAVQH